MLKKGIAAAALIAATSSVYAGGVEVAPAYIGGAYVDVGLSRDDVYDKFRRNTTDSVLTDLGDNRFAYATFDQYRRVDAGARGWDGFVGVGYNFVLDNEWSLGFELFGDVSSARGTQFEASAVNYLSNAVISNSIYLRAERTLGASFMPGYYVAPGSLYFLELGYVNTEYDLAALPAPFLTNGLNGNAFPSREINKSGFRLGWGTTTQVGPHLAVRQEYVWETYGNFATRRVFNAVSEPLSVQSNQYARISPNISKYNLAAVYYFARQGNAPDLNTAPAHVGGNIYVGLNGSYDEDYAHSEFRTLSVLATSNVNNFVTENASVGENALMKITGWNVGLFVGYGYNFTNRWYLGGEMFANYDDVSGRYIYNQGNVTGFGADGAVSSLDTTAQILSRLQKNWDFGVAIIPGFQVSDNALLYARVGYVGADFNIRNSWTGVTGITVAQNTLASFNRTRWLSGLQLGVGVDTVVYENLSLRSEFNVNNFGNFNGSTQINNVNSGDTTTVSTLATRHRRIIEDQFNVALIWHFFA